jgi:uncharacterized flavoprotein (TIGR03862 family)
VTSAHPDDQEAPQHRTPTVAVIGGGPAGLMAAEILGEAGVAVTVLDHMPSVGRKLLLAGRGGLNLTHAEEPGRFLSRYGAAEAALAPLIEAFPPTALRAWADGLGQATFVGSSGRVFPKSLKTSPLLRAWLHRLDGLGVRLALRREWLGWDETGRLLFRHLSDDRTVETVAADATVLALGGASWPRLGSDGAWVRTLDRAGIAVSPLRPANCGFEVAWSAPFRHRFAGQPLKKIALSFAGRTVPGEAVVTGYGIEGGAVYALSAALRDAIARDGRAVLEVDLRPDLEAVQLAERLGRLPAGQSLANGLRKAAGLTPVAANLLREAGGEPGGPGLPREPDRLATLVKAAPLVLTAAQPLARAISTAGGVAFAELDQGLMLRARPGVFVAGEILDWEAPTGGYLLQATFATAVAAARGVLRWLGRGRP